MNSPPKNFTEYSLVWKQNPLVPCAIGHCFLCTLHVVTNMLCSVLVSGHDLNNEVSLYIYTFCIGCLSIKSMTLIKNTVFYDYTSSNSSGLWLLTTRISSSILNMCVFLTLEHITDLLSGFLLQCENIFYYINTNEIPGELSSHVKIICYLHMWKYHLCYGYIINRAFHTKKLLKWDGLVFHWCLYNK